MKIRVIQLVVCEDGEHNITHYRTAEDAEQTLRDEYGDKVESDYSDEELEDFDDFLTALADYGIDAHIEEFVLDTDDHVQVDPVDPESQKWAKCDECGGEVLFDALVTYNGDAVSTLPNTFCRECDGEARYTVVSGDPEGAVK